MKIASGPASYMQKRVASIPCIYDLDERFRVMERFPEYVQVLTLGSPPVEALGEAADYPGESGSRYELWWAFGWPYETAVFMARLVFAGIFDRHPSLRMLTHHAGGMVPHFAGRIGLGLDQLGARTPDEDLAKVRA